MILKLAKENTKEKRQKWWQRVGNKENIIETKNNNIAMDKLV